MIVGCLELSSRLDQDFGHSPMILNLSGGLDWESQLTAIFVPTSIKNVSMSVPSVTNTSCAYLINREMAKLAIETQSTVATVLGIDWFWNWILMRNPQSYSLHLIPPLYVHGSISGGVKSWHPRR